MFVYVFTIHIEGKVILKDLLGCIGVQQLKTSKKIDACVNIYQCSLGKWLGVFKLGQ